MTAYIKKVSVITYRHDILSARQEVSAENLTLGKISNECSK